MLIKKKICVNNRIGDIMDYFMIGLKSIIIFIVLMLMIRLLGKKELGQLSTFDLVVLLIIADIGSIAIENGDSFYSTLLVFLILFILQKIFSWLLLRFFLLRNVFDGKPTIIVESGKLNIKTMKKELYTVDDLINQMRKNSVMDIKEIKLAILETSGDLSVFTYKENKEIILPVITSGKICKDMLKHVELTEQDVIKMAKNKGYIVNNIYYASSNGKELFITTIN